MVSKAVRQVRIFYGYGYEIEENANKWLAENHDSVYDMEISTTAATQGSSTDMTMLMYLTLFYREVK